MQPTDSVLRALTDHYNNTFEMTWRLWMQRNRTFLTLLVVIALAIIFTNPALLGATLNIAIRNTTGNPGGDGAGVPIDPITYQVFHSFLIVTIFYLMVNLYHRSASVARSYLYLGQLEEEIRACMALTEAHTAFTRESAFYWRNRPMFFNTVKYLYIIIISLMFVFQYYIRFLFDLNLSRNLGISGAELFHVGGVPIVLAIDTVVCLLTLSVLLAYIGNSIGLDKPPASRSIAGPARAA